MKRFDEMGDAELAAALQALRPAPSPSFAAELDGRVAAGFPRRSPQGARNPLARFFAWLRDGSRLRLLVPAGGVAVSAVLVAFAVAIAQSGGGGTSSLSMSREATSGSAMEQAAPNASGGASADGAEEAAESASGAEAEAPAYKEAEDVRGPAEIEIPAAGVKGGTKSNGSAAVSQPHRDVERGAQIVIGAKPGEVGAASSQVFEIVHANDGIVLNSSTQDGSGADAEAEFELLIPGGKVDDAMASFSQIGEVVNRHETTDDITAPTVGTSEQLQDSEARIEGLLTQLSETTDESEREVVEAELDSERGHAGHLKSKLADLKQRANLARVSVRIVSGKGAVSPGGGSSDDGEWGVDDALHDAGHLLATAAGVAIISLAVLAPLALILFLAWLAGRTWTRRARERALT
jgi:hypothetical protein